MKTINVVAAIICDSIQDKNKIFATARGYGDFKGSWLTRETIYSVDWLPADITIIDKIKTQMN